MKLFKTIEVWRRAGNERIVNYRCIQTLPEKKYVIQSADFYSLPITEDQVHMHNKQFLELFSEEDPFIRNDAFDTIEEAIKKHDEEFSDIFEGNGLM